MIDFTERRAVKRGIDQDVDLDVRIVGFFIIVDPGRTVSLEEWLNADE